jgi:hypothetical protein
VSFNKKKAKQFRSAVVETDYGTVEVRELSALARARVFKGYSDGVPLDEQVGMLCRLVSEAAYSDGKLIFKDADEVGELPQAVLEVLVNEALKVNGGEAKNG